VTGTVDVGDSRSLLEVSDQAPADWSDLVDADSLAEYSHTRHWIEAVSGNMPGSRPIWLMIRRDGRPVAGLSAVRGLTRHGFGGVTLKRSCVESSFEGTSGGPVLADDLEPDDQQFLFSALVDRLASLRRGWLGSCSMVLSPRRETQFRAAMEGKPGWTRRETLTALISLEGGEEAVSRDRLGPNKRNERNRGLRRGLKVEVTKDPDLLGKYYRIYTKAARHWGARPAPLSLLADLVNDPNDEVFFTCVRLGDKVVGGHVNLHHGPKVLVWNGVTDPAYAKKYFPATTCIWGDLVEACRRGADWLDLGGSGSMNSLSGFKKFFGAEMHTRGLYLNDAPVLAGVRRLRRLWRERPGVKKADRWHDTLQDPDKRENA